MPIGGYEFTVQWQAQLISLLRPFSKVSSTQSLSPMSCFLPSLEVQLVSKLVIQAFRGEITLLFGDPFLQSHMRGDSKLSHED